MKSTGSYQRMVHENREKFKRMGGEFRYGENYITIWYKNHCIKCVVLLDGFAERLNDTVKTVLAIEEYCDIVEKCH